MGIGLDILNALRVGADDGRKTAYLTGKGKTMTDKEKLTDLLTDVLGMSIGFKADHLIANGVTFQKWIPVSERLPEEHDSIFKKWYGTKLWQSGMFCTTSNMVLASIENNDGTRKVKAMHTQGGEWNLDSMPWAKMVTHWMPLPEPPTEE
jgi:hypothetical protein